jgi:RNA-directed DNA polymerase
MMHLIKMWLKVPVEERDENGKRRMSGGKNSTCGTPQGGVISPLLANLYMNRFLKYWRMTGRSEAFKAQVVNYADDFVILSRGHAAEALNWTRMVMPRIGLTLNETKTSIKQARSEYFDFLGYTFGPHYIRKNGRRFIGESPSKKSISRLRQKVADLLQPWNVSTWPEVRDRLNAVLRGWTNYFSCGEQYQVFRAVDNYVYARVRIFLRRRHKVSSLGISQFSERVVFGKMGVLLLRAVALAKPPVS